MPFHRKYDYIFVEVKSKLLHMVFTSSNFSLELLRQVRCKPASGPVYIIFIGTQ